MPDWGLPLVIVGNVVYLYVWACNVRDRKYRCH